jgi:hypothetical protein
MSRIGAGSTQSTSASSLATVGYGDLVPTTPFSKIFTIFYIANGLGIMLSFFDSYASLRTGRTVAMFEQ